MATAPVCLVPTMELSSTAKSQFCERLSATIRAWPGWSIRRDNGPLTFDFTVFTQPPFSIGATASLKPVLEFENLRLPISQIADWSKTPVGVARNQNPYVRFFPRKVVPNAHFKLAGTGDLLEEKRYRTPVSGSQ